MWREWDYFPEMVNWQAAKQGQNMKSMTLPAEVMAGVAMKHKNHVLLCFYWRLSTTRTAQK